MTTPQPRPSPLVPEFLVVVARFADILVEMDMTTPAALAALAELAKSPGFSRLAAAALEAWAVRTELIEPVPAFPKAIRAIRDVRALAAHLDALLSYSSALPTVQESLDGLWRDPTFASLVHLAQQAHARQIEGRAF